MIYGVGIQDASCSIIYEVYIRTLVQLSAFPGTAMTGTSTVVWSKSRGILPIEYGY